MKKSQSSSAFKTIERKDNFTRVSDVPGPGSYKVPSDFGHYVSRNAFEEVQNKSLEKGDGNLKTEESKNV